MESFSKTKSTMLTTLAFVLAVELCLVNGLSFRDSKEGRESYYNFLVESRANGKVYDGRELRVECKDRLQKGFCKAYKPLCKQFRIIKEICAETCGICKRAYFPVPCASTKFGCCWDNVTKSQGPAKEGCPACVDTDPDCQYLKDRCAERVQVRRLCPRTCGVQCETCADDPFQASVCSEYKSAGFCHIDPDLMKKYCKKTCGFCH
eukprot:gene13947-15403_t